MNVAALFVDVGDTLVYPHPSSTEVIAAVCGEVGFPVDVARVESVETAVGPRILEMQQAATELYSISMDNSRRFWTAIYHEMLERLEAPHGVRDEIALRLHARFNALETWRLFEDAVPALETLQARRREGLVMGIISNWEDWLDALLSHLEIDRFFDFAIISAGVQLEKPDPAIFHAALERAGAPAERAMHVGDSVHADVEGALGVGIQPILLDRRGRYAERPDRLPAGTSVIRSLAELPGLLG